MYQEVKQKLSVKYSHLSVYTRDAEEILSAKLNEEFHARPSTVVFEITADLVDIEWWSHYRAELEERFKIRDIQVRALLMRRL